MKYKCIINSFSPEETVQIAKKVADHLSKGSIVCLDGDLGAGKTIFAKGLIKALGVIDLVTSPTFTIVNEYRGRFPVYHFDVYRIDNPYEMYDIGFDEYIFGEGISVIEWGSKIKEILPDKYVEIILEKDLSIGTNYRKLIIEAGDDNIII
jgi:tRNA threonylcarbamoyladenosine biosynthesis protein TsaE